MYNDQPPTGKNAPKAKAHSKGNNEFLEFENINLIFSCHMIYLTFVFIFKKKNTSIDDFLFKIIGVLAFDKNTGFWMISSIPRFPANTSKGYMFQNEQKKYGQIVLCYS